MTFRRISLPESGEVLYLSPSWKIKTETRDWNWERGAAGWTPKRQWCVYRRYSKRLINCFPRYRDVVDYCVRRDL